MIVTEIIIYDDRARTDDVVVCCASDKYRKHKIVYLQRERAVSPPSGCEMKHKVTASDQVSWVRDPK